MKKLKIEIGDDNEILRTVSAPIAKHEFREYKALANAMLKHIKNPRNGGVGLSAPQVGVNKRIIVVSLMESYDDENFRTIVMVNPEILEHSDKLCSDTEGCLSLPDESGDVERWTEVKIQFFDIDGKKYILELKKLAARIVQHEIDHLDGILFTDRVK